MSDRSAALWLFLAVATVQSLSPFSVQSDSMWSIPTAASLLHEGNLDLEEFRGATLSFGRHGVREVEGRLFGEYPIGVPLVAAPVLALIDGGLSLLRPLFPHLKRPGKAAGQWLEAFHRTGAEFDIGYFDSTERFIASLFVAGATVLLYLAIRRRHSLHTAVLAALIFAFATTAYSTASRSLWQHGPSLLFIGALLFLLTRESQTRASAAAAGFCVAFAYVIRPTNAVSAVALTLLFFFRFRAQLLAFLAGAAAVALPFCAYNLHIHGSLFSPYYSHALGTDARGFITALLGQMLSPSRGLLVFTPFLVFALVEAARRIREKAATPVEVTFIGILLAHWLVISAWPMWWAGHSIGPRLFTDVLPYLLWFLVPAIERVATEPLRRPALTGFFAALVAFSLWIQIRGSTRADLHDWNDGPPNVDAAPARLWDLRDAQWLRGF